jgi:hypothetical protein
MHGRITLIQDHLTHTAEVKVQVVQRCLPTVWPWQELAIHSLVVTPAPPEVQMSSADDDKNILGF